MLINVEHWFAVIGLLSPFLFSCCENYMIIIAVAVLFCFSMLCSSFLSTMLFFLLVALLLCCREVIRKNYILIGLCEGLITCYWQHYQSPKKRTTNRNSSKQTTSRKESGYNTKKTMEQSGKHRRTQKNTNSKYA